jgi:glucose uptake protein GlcU
MSTLTLSTGRHRIGVTVALIIGATLAASALLMLFGAVDPAMAANTLEKASQKAEDTARTVVASLIGVGFCVAAVILVFRRDFRDAAAAFAVGLVAIVLATDTGYNMLTDLSTKLFG